MQDKKNIKVRPQSFRLDKWLDNKLISIMKKHNVNKTEALHILILSLENKIKKKDEVITKLKTESPNTLNEMNTDKDYRKIGCPVLLKTPEGEYVCANKAPKIIPIPFLGICKVCWERKQKEKISQIPKRKIPNMYKKKAQKIRCLGENILIDPLLNQAKCYRCSTRTPKIWIQCKQKQTSTI
jgi:hypothetical protein